MRQKNYAWRSRKWTISRQAKAGEPVAMNGLGWLYENGLGVEKDGTQGDGLVSQSRGRGVKKVRRPILAGCSQHGEDITAPRCGRIILQAPHWYRKAAAAGDVHAYARIGRLYERGLGVTQDYAAALQWYRKGADAGSAGCDGQPRLVVSERPRREERLLGSDEVGPDGRGRRQFVCDGKHRRSLPERVGRCARLRGGHEVVSAGRRPGIRAGHDECGIPLRTRPRRAGECGGGHEMVHAGGERRGCRSRAMAGREVGGDSNGRNNRRRITRSRSTVGYARCR